MKWIIVLIFLLLTASFSDASELSGQIEERIMAKDWKGVHAILNKYDNKSSSEKGRHNLVEATRAVMSYFRNYDTFMGFEGKDAYSYLKALNNGYNNIPKTLPFSQKLIDEIRAKKSSIDERLVQMDDAEKKQKKETEAKQEEVRQKHEEAERIQVQQVRDRFTEQQKQVEVHAQGQVAQDEAERSSEYLKLNITCKICSATEDKKSVEMALNNDMSYSKKYGVINYSRRDSGVQSIKYYDGVIRDGKSEYRELFKKPFNAAACKKIKCDDCEQLLSDLSAKLTEKFLDGKK